jgi:cation transport ATPase
VSLIQQHSLMRRLLIDLGIGVGIIAVAGLVALVSIRTGKAISGAWIGLVGYTPVIFWFAIRPLKNYWNRATFWLSVVALLAAHSLAFLLILRSYPEWRMIWFVPVAIVEAGLFSSILASLFKRRASPEH